MSFALTREQRDLADGVAALLADRATGAYAREVISGEADWRDLWSKIAELGIAAIAVPEERGGLGLGAVELAAVCEAAGRFLAPAPLVATAGWFVPLVDGAAGDARAESLAAVVDEGGAATVGYVDPFVASGSISLDGDSLTVADLLVADGERVDRIAFVVPGADDAPPSRLAVVAAADLLVEPVEGLDPTRPLARVSADGAAATVAPLAPDALAVPFVAAAAELVGIADEMLRIATRYAGEREQFGTKIGAFQAIKHRLVDSLLLVERARSLTFRAAVLADEGAPGTAGAIEGSGSADNAAELLTAAHLAKGAAAEAATEVVRAAVQVHGGVGVTAEHDVSLFYLRARQASTQLGGRDGHYAAATRSLGSSGAIG